MGQSESSDREHPFLNDPAPISLPQVALLLSLSAPAYVIWFPLPASFFSHHILTDPHERPKQLTHTKMNAGVT